MDDRLSRDLFLGFIKIHILYHAAKEDIFGQDFQYELKRHGYDVSFGTLYPIFHRLEKQGYLESYKKNVDGKVRRYYKITKQGKKVLEKARKQAKELAEELFED
ncbi:MAG TPA: PadR family transcriptional regulator [Ignavibacteriaceae bacterium]|nr:PadR family transcriptional regulator [Ignavibacteriaceae bacterium]